MSHDDLRAELLEHRRDLTPYVPHRCPPGRPCADCITDITPDEH